MIQATTPDVIVLDLRLRDGGWPRRPAAGPPPRLPSARILVFTNHPADVFREVYTAGGRQAFLDKSRDSEQLVQRIEAMTRPA